MMDWKLGAAAGGLATARFDADFFFVAIGDHYIWRVSPAYNDRYARFV